VKPQLSGLAAMLTLLVATVAAQAPQRPPRDLPGNRSVPNTGVITGIVRAADTGAPLRGDLDAALRDLSQAARSLRSLSEQLEERPNAIIFGNPRQ